MVNKVTSKDQVSTNEPETGPQEPQVEHQCAIRRVYRSSSRVSVGEFAPTAIELIGENPEFPVPSFARFGRWSYPLMESPNFSRNSDSNLLEVDPRYDYEKVFAWIKFKSNAGEVAPVAW